MSRKAVGIQEVARLAGFCAAFLALILVTVSKVQAEDEAALKQRMHHAAELSSLDQERTQPWHLKLVLTEMNGNDVVADAGSMQEWWAGPELYRIVYTQGTDIITELRNGEGFHHRSGGAAGDLEAELMLRNTVHPMPDDEEIDTGHVELQPEQAGKVNLIA